MVRRNSAGLRFPRLILLVMLIGSVHVEAEPIVFSTWSVFEVDKCASIWLIKRFIEPTATFRFYPPSAPIEEGIAFDTPDARFRRTARQATFEQLLSHYQISDLQLHQLAQIIHDIEINMWARKALPETTQLMQALKPLFAQTDPQSISEACLAYFDRFYAERRFPTSSSQAAPPPCCTEPMPMNLTDRAK